MMKRILAIAGTDSSGGAGLEADQKVIAAHGCYAMTATTALTAQNTQGVYGIHETPSDFVSKQIDACIDDIGVDVVKTGMLASARTVSSVANSLRRHNVAVTVVDPVMIATSGAQLLPESAVETLCNELLPLTSILTPNIPEANLLLRTTGHSPADVVDIDGLKDLAAAVLRLGPQYVLIKGGHLPLKNDFSVAKTESEKAIVVNVLLGPGVERVISLPYSNSRNTHGTGCSLASSIACNLAKGFSVERAVVAASYFVEAGINTSVNLGHGSGPLNHFHSLHILPFAPGRFIEYVLERDDVKPAWHQYTHHDFVERMGNGSLPEETFKYYMIQDYLFLIQFSRANSLAGYKAKSLDEIALAAETVLHIRSEIKLHLSECKTFGLEKEVIEEYEESQACTAYTRFVLDIGQSEDWFALQISLLPCLLGYHKIAHRLDQLRKIYPSTQPNRYSTWIDNYVAEDYVAAVKKSQELIEKYATKQAPGRIEELVKIFVHATKMETGFWDMAGKA